MSRYLSKSRFKLAYTCPAKLYFHERPGKYGNLLRENAFLEALAGGGFQVGALAKLHFQDGIDLEGVATEDAILRTRELLTQDRVTVFEAALVSGPFLVRVDVLVKEGTRVSLLEVKSKSHDFSEGFFKKRGTGLASAWEPYLVDVAYQTWVARKAYPAWSVEPYLMLPDKAARASVDGLHQCFRLDPRDPRAGTVHVRAGLRLKDLGDPVLRSVGVDREVEYLLREHMFPGERKLPEYAAYLAEHHAAGTRGASVISAQCKGCEFRIPLGGRAPDVASGFEECWREAGKLAPADAGRPLIFDLWRARSEAWLEQGLVFLDQLQEEDLQPKARPAVGEEAGLSTAQRQWIQVQKSTSREETPFVDRAGLEELFARVHFPLHCIDFETTTVALPFHRGRRPYEQIAFQFSHHVLFEDGRVAHVDQHLDARAGVFPNFDFVRKLRASLAGDRGTVFRYADHENTVLRQIRRQLETTPPEDARELIAFIDEMTRPNAEERKLGASEGTRAMLDLKELVVRHYYHPRMGGSNSIKKVIPAVLGESLVLQERYAHPTYGRGLATPSLNFDAIAWIERDARGRVRDPYKRLPPIFKDLDQSWFAGDEPLFAAGDGALEGQAIDDGGAAMTAWSRMQFTEMGELERSAIQEALLKYCELDTLSMVWLLEYWRSLIA